MNFQKLLSSYTLTDSLWITREEKAVFSALLEEFKERSIETMEGELIFDVVNGKEEVIVLKNGYATAIDFVSWNDLLGFQVDLSFLEKQTTIHRFIELVFMNMMYEGVDEKKRENRIAELKKSFPLADCDEHSWYEMTQTIQGKARLLFEGEIYRRNEFLPEGIRVVQLLEEKKVVLW